MKSTDFDRPASDDLDALLDALPSELGSRVRALPSLDGLLEIVMDLGRLPEARFAGREERLSEREVSADDIAWVTARLGHFGGDNRAGIERTLHRISALRNREGMAASKSHAALSRPFLSPIGRQPEPGSGRTRGPPRPSPPCQACGAAP